MSQHRPLGIDQALQHLDPTATARERLLAGSPSGATRTGRPRCEKAQTSRPITHSEHRAVAWSYHTRWLGLKQALHRPHSTLTARERPFAWSPARAAGKGPRRFYQQSGAAQPFLDGFASKVGPARCQLVYKGGGMRARCPEFSRCS